MHKMFKWKYLFCVRFDSHYFLKLLIIFNLFLGIYLIFLSTNYRKYNEYYNNKEDIKVPFNALNKLNPNNKLSNDALNKIGASKLSSNLGSKIIKDEEDKSIQSNINNDPANVIDKIYDSNNKLVVQDSGGGGDVIYKKVEDDDKTVDENDKLRIEMLDKQNNQNSIIHDRDFTVDNDSKDKSNGSVLSEKNTNNNNNDGKNQISKPKEAVSKDVINRILDHNLHISKNNSKLIIPESIPGEASWWTIENRGKYSVIRNYIQGLVQVEPNVKSVTLTTQGTPEFLYHAEQLCDRWDGFISLAVYAPGTDFNLAINMIYYLRQCANKCIAQRVYWHMVFDTVFAPVNVTSPTAYLEIQNFDCNIGMSETMKLFNISSDFRKLKSLPYPINVLRNVARNASMTKYLFASDIELYPSVGIIPAFFDLLEREKSGLVPLINAKNKHVYVVPIFEVKANKSAPRTKSELSRLFHSKDAIFFHRYVCDVCQNFPDRDIWVNEIPDPNTMNVFRVTRRLRERNQWEPLYIGTNDEPFYDERLTWEGKRDKMSQMYEMCLMNYDLLVLDNAFLVHAPGIKYYSVKDDKKRQRFIWQNQKVYTSVMANLRKKYGNKNKC